MGTPPTESADVLAAIERRGQGVVALMHKLLWGYLPYSIAGLACIVLLISFARTWEAVLAGGVFIAIFGALYLVAQLTLLLLPSQPRRRFLAYAGALSIFNLLVSVPLLAYLLQWVVRAMR